MPSVSPRTVLTWTVVSIPWQHLALAEELLGRRQSARAELGRIGQSRAEFGCVSVFNYVLRCYLFTVMSYRVYKCVGVFGHAQELEGPISDTY